MSKIREKESLECGRMYIWALKTQKLPGLLSRPWTPAANCSLRLCNSTLLCRQLSASEPGAPPWPNPGSAPEKIVKTKRHLDVMLQGDSSWCFWTCKQISTIHYTLKWAFNSTTKLTLTSHQLRFTTNLNWSIAEMCHHLSIQSVIFQLNLHVASY